MKKLHDLLLLRITQEDKEKKTFPLVQIVRRAGIKWEPEFPVDKGWIDIYVPVQKNVEHAYAIEVETGYDLDCSQILRKFERFRTAMTSQFVWAGETGSGGSETISPKLCVIIPKDFAEFIPLFRAKEISVFLWEGTLEWKCKKCEKITLSSGPWKPKECGTSSCKRSESSLRLIGLSDFGIKEA